MSADFDTERLCRLNGKQPTMRDRWTAFYRLYRISQGIGAWQDIAAGDCFRVLFNNWSWIRLVDDEVPTLSRVHWPTFLRRQIIKMERDRRLYGNHKEEWKKRDKWVANKCHNEGTEVTPDEVAVVRRKIIDLARAKGQEMGMRLPKDDDDLLRLLKPKD